MVVVYLVLSCLSGCMEGSMSQQRKVDGTIQTRPNHDRLPLPFPFLPFSFLCWSLWSLPGSLPYAFFPPAFSFFCAPRFCFALRFVLFRIREVVAIINQQPKQDTTPTDNHATIYHVLGFLFWTLSLVSPLPSPSPPLLSHPSMSSLQFYTLPLFFRLLVL